MFIWMVDLCFYLTLSETDMMNKMNEWWLDFSWFTICLRRIIPGWPHKWIDYTVQITVYGSSISTKMHQHIEWDISFDNIVVTMLIYIYRYSFQFPPHHQPDHFTQLTMSIKPCLIVRKIFFFIWNANKN